MAWPTDTITTAHLDAATDDPSQARVELYNALVLLKAVIAAPGTASGICDLDSSAKVPSGRLSATAITTALGYTPWHAGNDGSGSGLDADTLDGLHASQLTAFPSGTKMLFQQSSAPTGWTKDTTHNDKALRVVSGTASSGGSVAFSTLFGRTATDAFTLTSAHIPSHTHSFAANTGTESADHVHYIDHTHTVSYVVTYDGTRAISSGSIYKFGSSVTTGNASTAYSGGRSAAHYHYVSGTTGGYGSSGSHSHAVDMRVQYVDLIICTKS